MEKLKQRPYFAIQLDETTDIQGRSHGGAWLGLGPPISFWVFWERWLLQENSRSTSLQRVADNIKHKRHWYRALSPHHMGFEWLISIYLNA